MALSDAPPLNELITAVMEYLQTEIVPEAVGEKKRLATIAYSVLAVVDREYTLGYKLNTDYSRLLATLGVTDEEELARKIRNNEIDINSADLKKALRQITTMKLMIASPAFLERARKEAEAAQKRQAAKTEA
jgi:hypothetical protein